METLRYRLVEAVNAPHQAISLLILIALCSFAIGCGGRAERLAGVAFIFGQVATVFSQDLTDWAGPQLAVLGVDLVMLAFLGALALRTDRAWTVFAAGFQLLVVFSHVALAIDPSLGGRAYWTVINLLGYFVFLALALGTWDAWRRRRVTAAETGR